MFGLTDGRPKVRPGVVLVGVVSYKPTFEEVADALWLKSAIIDP